jgi:hypothetical protein
MLAAAAESLPDLGILGNSARLLRPVKPGRKAARAGLILDSTPGSSLGRFPAAPARGQNAPVPEPDRLQPS